MSRLMDQQQDNVYRLNNLLQNIKKLSIEKRDQKHLIYQNEQREIIFKQIEDCHSKIMDHGAPEGYEEKYNEAIVVNEKILSKLHEFGYISTPKEPPKSDVGSSISTSTTSSNNTIITSNKINESSGANHGSQENKHEDKLVSILEKLLENQLLLQKRPSYDNVQSLKPMNVKIQNFSGDVSQYNYFKEAIQRSLDNTNWANVEKFVFLREHLEGNPLKMISILQIEQQSYEKAWDILNKFYDCPRKLVSQNIRQLTDKSFFTKEDDLTSLKEFRHIFEAVKANINQLQITTDQIVAEIVISRLDRRIANRFEDYIGYTRYTPDLEQISEFLIKEEIQIENLSRSNSYFEERKIIHQSDSKVKTQKSTISRAHVTQDEKAIMCFICKSLEHTTLQCPAILTASDKIGLLKLYKLCIFCGKHRYDRKRQCKSRDFLKCQTCNGKHVTELHPNKSTQQFEVNASTSKNFDAQLVSSHLEQPISTNQAHTSSPSENDTIINTLFTQQKENESSLMPTVIANVCINKHQTIPVRCLVDQCSERSYISERLANVLGLKRNKINEIIKGINNVTTFATHYITFTIKFKDHSLADLIVDALILPQIAGKIPRNKVSSGINSLNLQLADPNCGDPDNVEVLLGGDVTSKIFKNNAPVKITKDGLIYQSTHFGWVISGNVSKSVKSSNYVSSYVTINECNQKLDKDIELSEKLKEFYFLPENEKEDKDANDYCEELFKSKHYRLSNGRYVVPTPWIPNAPELGSSYYSSRACFINQEKKWRKDPIHYSKSNEFMLEYFKMGHMINIPEKYQRQVDTPKVCYIPYISIVRKNAYTTKLRNVFNASSKTDNGVTLNDTMFEGKKLQNKIFDIVTKCRSFKYMYSADIVKMFRQIMIRTEDRDKLRILWRHDQSAPLNEFHLTTVTYGTDAAPWQAIRTIHQCAEDNAPTQQICEIIKSSFYVDDLLNGADSIEECKQQIKDIISTMSSGHLPLAKWMSNNDLILDQIPADKRLEVCIGNKIDQVKILGLIYDKTSDSYKLNINTPNEMNQYTKRSVASVAASFYDPIGFILPFVMLLRIFLRNVWAENIDWNEKLGDDMSNQFNKYVSKVTLLKSISIPRWIGSLVGDSVDFIGFSDASNDAQAAVIYSRIKVNDKYIINLVAARGNVNKLKTLEIIKSKQQTIPKLELEAIVTLVNLYDSIKNCMSHLKISFTAYTDSQIALSWVRNNKVNQKVIRRKVDKILKIINPEQLHYVNGSENPADPASRGLTADKLMECKIFYDGPAWLHDDVLPVFDLKNKNEKSQCFVLKSEEQYDMFHRFSNFCLVVKVTVLILRWKKYKKDSPITCYKRYLKSSNGKLYFEYNAEEIQYATLCIIKYYQRLYLGEVVQKLQKNCIIQKGHWLYKLSPFLDENGLIRVGGRLTYADIPENLKHPIAIPESNLKNLIIKHTHLNNMHAGNSLMLQIINETYWIPRLRLSIHRFIQNCVVCARWRNKRVQPEMAQLPAVRVNEALPFENTGVDLAGPFHIKSSTLRKAQIIKVWIVTFVCMLTKALHLEVVSSMDTEHFIASFDRFTSRRGIPKQVWSDNGKNFIGANRMLTESWMRISNEIQNVLALQGIKWIFIPRYSPSFGGLWEASVKSIKYFTHRMQDIKNLTLEEFTTLLCKVEFLLNSRPITIHPISPFEESPLTPFQFLTGRGVSINSITAQGVHQSPLKKKWLEILKIQHQLWKRFQKEYLQQLQKKVKWIRKDRELKEGELVLVDDNNTQPGEWKRGTVVKTYKDRHGVARKADINYADGKKITESIKNLIPLNIIDSKEEQPKSPSNKRKITATQVLLVWLACITGIHANNVNILEPGVHAVKLKEVYLKVTNLEFSIVTNYNLTADLNSIQDHIKEFEEFCNTNINNSTINIFCKNLLKTIKLNSNEVINSIKNEFKLHKRSKRFVHLGTIGTKILSIGSKAVSKESRKFLLKHSPEILMTAGLAYQGYEISQLENKQVETELKLKATSEAILKTISTEEHVLEKHLKNLKKTQEEQNFVQAINSYSETTSILIDTINNRYKSLKKIEPENELKTYIMHNKNQTFFDDLELPEIDNLFTDSKYTIVNDIIVITYKIPLVHTYKISKYAIISVPSSNNKMIRLSNEQNLMLIVVNNSKYAVIDKDLQIYENLDWLNLDECLLSALKIDKISLKDNCPIYNPINTEEKILKLNEHLTLILAKQKSTTITCKDNYQIYQQPVLLLDTHENCMIEMGGMRFGKIYGKEFLKQSEKIPDLTIPILKTAEITIREDLKDVINNLTQTVQNTNYNIQPWQFGIGGTTLTITILLATIFAVRYYKNIKSQKPWFPNWTGPAAMELNTTQNI